MPSRPRRARKSMAFDLMVLDIMMPGQDGLSLTEELRGESEVPILLLTARGAPEDRIRGLEAGADDYLRQAVRAARAAAADRHHPAPCAGDPHRRHGPLRPVHLQSPHGRAAPGRRRRSTSPPARSRCCRRWRRSRAGRSAAPSSATRGSSPAPTGRSTCRWHGCAARSRTIRASRATSSPCAAPATCCGSAS